MTYFGNTLLEKPPDFQMLSDLGNYNRQKANRKGLTSFLINRYIKLLTVLNEVVSLIPQHPEGICTQSVYP